MHTLHLFAGAGGGLLADLILGHTPICAVEWDPYCCAVLRQRALEGWFPGMCILEGDIRRFDPSQWEGKVDCIAAGFPCQPWSTAKRGRGNTYDGFPDVMRVVRCVRPDWLFLENVPGVRKDIRYILSESGYYSESITTEACSVGRPHRGERWWLLASSNKGRESVVPVNAQTSFLQKTTGPIPNKKPSGLGMAYGVPSRLDRFAIIGNAQVPLQAAAAWVLLGGPTELTDVR